MNTSSALPHQFSSPFYRRLGYLVWLILAILSVVFYKERATFMDGGFQLTELINNGTFGIYHYRLTNPLTQILALAAIKMGLSLKTVMILYSLNFILFFAAVHFLIVRWCKNDFLAWTQIAFFTFLATDSFYFLTPEYYQGMSLLLLWFAMILRFDFKQKWLLPALSLLLIPIIFDHLLLTAFFIFLWFFFGLHEAKLWRWQYLFLAVTVAIIFVVHQKFFVSWYDAAKTESFTNNFEQYFPNFHTIPAHEIFLGKLKWLYPILPISLLLLTFKYLYAFYKNELRGSLNLGKKHVALQVKLERFFPLIKLLLILGFCFSYLLIIHIGDPETPYIFYAEVNYLGLAIPIAVAYFFDFMPKIQDKRQTKIILTIIVFISFFKILNTYGKFEFRHNWMLSQFENKTTNRVIIKAENPYKNIYIQEWSVPYESLLITALDGPKSAKSLLIATEEKQYKDYLNEENLLLEVMRQTDVDSLNKAYFDLGKNKYFLEPSK